MGKGRTKAFDVEAALDAAMLTFWRHGYDRTTLQDLTAEMGINRPSLYGAFGDKSRLFISCLNHYTESIVAQNEAKLFESTVWTQAIDVYLNSWVADFTAPEFPGGCLLASHLGEDSSLDSEILAQIQSHASATENTLCKRLKLAVAERQLDQDTHTASLARTILCFLAGLSAMARLGTSRRVLKQSTRQFVSMLETFSTCPERKS